ncbi:hypothetical protein JI742_07515 [Piscinibacter sp. Jin2]|uniref:Uncharacterized protein n=1 Tax=Aquariibacter lacus TaxID=2801332 RepID=A0A9X1BRA7_9BURK|nr:hypothetical protein [Piscinibacter lacus]MBL0719734.1 hypothetical protein [Piscinibacter lacus]
MHTKTRGQTAYLYRSTWVRKGTRDNTHGYSLQTFVGSIRRDAFVLPDDLAAKLTEGERAYIEATICRPAREAAERARREAELHEADPLWRLAEAGRLASEAAERSRSRRVHRQRVMDVSEALAKVQVIDPVETPRAPDKRADPLQDALVSIRAAAAAVRGGAYGRAPETGVRSTRPYRLWSDIYEAVCGTDGDAVGGSLMRALQDRGFAKSRQR